jgi:hypothetical protein
MPQAWGSATENAGGGGGADPNVLKLEDQTRIRLLDGEGPRKWRQHNLRGEDLHPLFPSVDESAFRSCTCPRGADGRGTAPCPLDMKPSYRAADGSIQQLFPVSIRYAANVWDYASGSVKILMGGKQIFQEFDAVAKAGFDPTACDFLIIKMGKDRQTSYKVVRGGTDPLPQEIKPEALHELDKFEAPDSADRIFEILNDLGVDYDAIELPSFTLDQANSFVIPYTKYKGQTMEQLYATDPDYMKWLYGTKRDQGQYGDAVFQAMHAVLLDAGETTPIDDMPKAPPRASVKQAPPAPPAGPSAEVKAGDAVLLVPPGGGEPTEFPRGALAGLLAAGFTESILPEPDPIAPPAPEHVILVGPGGDEQDVSQLPDAAIGAMLAAGYKPKAAFGDDDEVPINIGGAVTTMKYSVAKTLIESGAAALVEA